MSKIVIAVPYKDQDHVRRGVVDQFGRVVEVSGVDSHYMAFKVNENRGWSVDQRFKILQNLKILVTGLLFPRE